MPEFHSWRNYREQIVACAFDSHDDELSVQLGGCPDFFRLHEWGNGAVECIGNCAQ